MQAHLLTYNRHRDPYNSSFHLTGPTIHPGWQEIAPPPPRRTTWCRFLWGRPYTPPSPLTRVAYPQHGLGRPHNFPSHLDRKRESSFPTNPRKGMPAPRRGFLDTIESQIKGGGCPAGGQNAVQPSVVLGRTQQPGAAEVSGLGPPLAGAAGLRTEVARPGAGHVGRLLLRLPPEGAGRPENESDRWVGSGQRNIESNSGIENVRARRILVCVCRRRLRGQIRWLKRRPPRDDTC